MIKQVSPSQQVILHLSRINYYGYMVNIPNLFNYQSTAGSVIFTACWIMQALFEVIAYIESTAKQVITQYFNKHYFVWRVRHFHQPFQKYVI